MISSLVIVNLKGDTLSYRDYRDEVSRVQIGEFISHLLDPKNTQVPPVYFLNGVSYFNIA